MREKVGLTALLALIVVLCPAFAIGQEIAGEREELFAVLPKEGRDRVAAIDPSMNKLNGRLTAAENRAKEARTDAAAAKTSADRVSNGLRRLGEQVDSQGKDIGKLNDAVLGPKGKDGKRTGGLNDRLKPIEGWYNSLVGAKPMADAIWGAPNNDGARKGGLVSEVLDAKKDIIVAKTTADLGVTNATKAQKTADGKADGWVVWPAWIGAIGTMAILLLIVLKLLKIIK